MRKINSLEFSPEIRDMEREVIEKLLGSQLLIGEKRSTALIISYFITRKNLTQTKLRELTDLSLGTVSQEINYLLERNIIKEIGRSKGENIYSMDSVTNGFIRSYLYSVKYYLKYKENFKDMKQDLEKNMEQLKDQEGFETIYRLVHLFIMMFPVVEKVIETLNNELKEE
ncbi:MAG: hypothetical protein EU539_13865 [Promethearchaeota archaeon]|nr:MAG: hypothetical protein EU539_13865 [Candidatus Lokiarchaeota archaeon]